MFSKVLATLTEQSRPAAIEKKYVELCTELRSVAQSGKRSFLVKLSEDEGFTQGPLIQRFKDEGFRIVNLGRGVRMFHVNW